MSDLFYHFIRTTWSPPIVVSSRRTLLHRDRVPRKGPFLLATPHFSPYDVALLIKDTPRVLNFVSVKELFVHPLSRWFLSTMHAMPLDRMKSDSPTIRKVLEHLSRGRAVAMFPEGGIRDNETSVLAGGKLKPGLARLARMANVPILPAVVLGARDFHQFKNWLPFKRAKYGVIYGEPVVLKDDAEAELEAFEPRLRKIFQSLAIELAETMKEPELLPEALRGTIPQGR